MLPNEHRFCRGCLEKQRRIDALEQQVARPRYQERTANVVPRSIFVRTVACSRDFIEQQTGVPYSRLVAALHQLARRFADVPDRLLRFYRRAPVKHAEETGWLDDGRNGYASRSNPVRLRAPLTPPMVAPQLPADAAGRLPQIDAKRRAISRTPHPS